MKAKAMPPVGVIGLVPWARELRGRCARGFLPYLAMTCAWTPSAPLWRKVARLRRGIACPSNWPDQLTTHQPGGIVVTQEESAND